MAKPKKTRREEKELGSCNSPRLIESEAQSSLIQEKQSLKPAGTLSKSERHKTEDKIRELNKQKRETEAKMQKLKESMGRGEPDDKRLESTPMKFRFDEQGLQDVLIDPKIGWGDIFKHIAGTKDTEIAENILRSAVDAIQYVIERGKGGAQQSSTGFNIVMQSLHDFQPKDAVEARLVSQATALFQNGMDRLTRAGISDRIDHSEAQTNMAVKLLRCHNETIEALSRYRRGGVQRVVVQHIAEKMAVVNNFGGTEGGGYQENKGASPCSENAERKPDPIKINHAASPQWQMGGADCTVGKVPDQEQKKDENA